MLAPPRLKPHDSVRIGSDTYAVRSQSLYDAPLLRWYEWGLYDAINAREGLLAQIGEGLFLVQREPSVSPIPPTAESLGDAKLVLKTRGQMRWETSGPTGARFGRGEFWRFDAPGGLIVIVTQLDDEATKLVATPLEESRIEVYPA